MMYRAEDHHWWYRGMRAITRAVLDRFVAREDGALRILDAGCGTGSTLEYLQDYGWTVGVDLAPEAVGFCSERGLPRLARASILELPFAADSFDLITSFDVVSSCRREQAPHALAEFFRVLRPGGHLLLRLPAYMWLRGRHDELVHTWARFSRGETRRLLRAQGFEIERLSYANCLLFPLAAAKRLKDRLLPPKQARSDVSVTGGWINPLFGALLRSEAPLVSRVGLPFGLTILALAKKPAA
ncbi:MAG: class I SAM-dependent methyltransferase [Planctomycetes bacterium]|nr:class I SAM-dependent methyltransferase [Planctomycetota bacterium]